MFVGCLMLMRTTTADNRASMMVLKWARTTAAAMILSRHCGKHTADSYGQYTVASLLLVGGMQITERERAPQGRFAPER